MSGFLPCDITGKGRFVDWQEAFHGRHGTPAGSSEVASGTRIGTRQNAALKKQPAGAMDGPAGVKKVAGTGTEQPRFHSGKQGVAISCDAISTDCIELLTLAVILVTDMNLAEAEQAAVIARVIAELTSPAARIPDESHEAAHQAARTRGERRLFGRGRRGRFTDLPHRSPTRPCGAACVVARAPRSPVWEYLRVLPGGFSLGPSLSVDARSVSARQYLRQRCDFSSCDPGSCNPCSHGAGSCGRCFCGRCSPARLLGWERGRAAAASAGGRSSRRSSTWAGPWVRLPVCRALRR